MFFIPPEDDRLPALKTYLYNAGWIPARQIRVDLGYTDRLCRALAEASAGEIISGQAGYKLTRQATPEEIQQATAWLESQARKMSLRAGAIRRCWHHAPHVQTPCKAPAG
jgi:hypothetical protein